MSELTDKLTAAAEQHNGTDFGGLLQWAVLHIESQDEALADVREELAAETADRIAMQHAISGAKLKMGEIVEALNSSRPVNISLSKDFAPHKNIMAQHGVEPYAKKPRKRAA